MHIRLLFIIFFVVLFTIPVKSVSFADEMNDIRNEFKQLKNEFKDMKQHYENRINDLEQKLSIAQDKKEEIDLRTESAYSKKTSSLELPEISVILNTEATFSDTSSNASRNKVRVKEAELAFQGYLYPGVRGDFIAALEQEYEGKEVSTEVDVEEAYLSFLELPLGLQATIGRKLLNFGRLNPLHIHHWAFTDIPLILQNFFGHHPWFDDGAELTWLVSNPLNVYLELATGIWNGKELGHIHEHSHREELDHEEDHDHFGDELIEWDDHVYTGRVFADASLTDNLNTGLGYSIAKDGGGRNTLHEVDLVFKYQWPFTYRRIKWHTELFYLQEDLRDINPYGVFSYAQLSLNKYWELGARYDWAEFADNDDEHAWAGSGFLTYYFTHTMHARGEYQYKEHASGEDENILFLQLVWGIGPHSHRLED